MFHDKHINCVKSLFTVLFEIMLFVIVELLIIC